jgi:hypothetical protein
MGEKIYLIGEDGELRPMEETAYESEDLLQALLAQYPDVLAGEHGADGRTRRWALVRREMGVPDREAGGDRWSLDHLFLDQDGIPTLVETKRSSDTRLRREVVGQMLDYAANAVAYWPLDQIQQDFARACAARRQDPEEILRNLIGEAATPAEFWDKVKTCLQAGRVRLVFVADVIPNELARVIEFLNVQMDPAEVLGIEVRQFVGDRLRTLVPRVIGQTAEAQRKKQVGQSTPRTPPEYWTEFQTALAESKVPIVQSG